MGDQDAASVPLCYSDGGVLRPVGDADGLSLSVDMLDEFDKYADAISRLPVCQSFTFSIPWHAQNSLLRMLSPSGHYKPRYTVARLRRGGKSHRGKEMKW